MMMVNVGCGQTPTSGWCNFDNSLSLRLSSIPLLPELLHKLNVLTEPQFKYIQFARKNQVMFADATRRLPLTDNASDAVCSSHMLEHLDRLEADRFLNEAFRVLRPDGVLRIVVPDIQKHAQAYIDGGDADAFVAATQMCVARPRGFAQRLGVLLVGARHHLWMYDGASLTRLLKSHGFVNVTVQPPGQTFIPAPGALDLRERESESVYVEGQKPGV